MSPLLAALIVATASPPPAAPGLQGDMAPLYAAVSWLAPRAAGAELEQSAAVGDALDLLASHAKRLESHVPPEDPAARAIARGLSRSARFARSRYRRGDRAHAAEIVRALTRACTACHLRHPRADARFSAGFTADPLVKKLDPFARATLFAAVRQSDAALKALEAQTLDEKSAWLVLNLTLRGQDDAARAARALRALQLDPPPPVPKTLDEAEALVAEDAPGDDRLAALVAARFLDRSLGEGDARTRARAHLLLGRAELILNDPAAATAVLEAGLALDPDGPWAEPLLELLYESYTRLNAPDPIPTDLERMLDELRGQARGKKKP